MSNLDALYTKKQQEVLDFYYNHDFFMLINHGAKRTGKTVLDNDLFLAELMKVRQRANEDNVAEPQYILAGATLGNVERNVLSELTNKYSLEFKFDKFNRFRLFGVLVCCFGHSTISDLGRIRGMTSYGAYINEGTMANEEVFNEIKSRCSANGARLLIDTNPDSPEHYLKRDYIDKADGETIAEFNYKLRDNTFLSERYIESIIKSTPSGMFTDRDINGEWVTAEGVVYQDFDAKFNYVYDLKKYEFVNFFCGVDWGYEHFGCICLFGETADGTIVLIKEWSAKHRDINYWLNIARGIKGAYGNVPFYCDSARPEHLATFLENGINTFGANKAVLSGIEVVATLLKTRKLLIYYPNVSLFRREIYKYIWNEKTGEPVKQDDDCMDTIRYAIYSRVAPGGFEILK